MIGRWVVYHAALPFVYDGETMVPRDDAEMFLITDNRKRAVVVQQTLEYGLGQVAWIRCEEEI